MDYLTSFYVVIKMEVKAVIYKHDKYWCIDYPKLNMYSAELTLQDLISGIEEELEVLNKHALNEPDEKLGPIMLMVKRELKEIENDKNKKEKA